MAVESVLAPERWYCVTPDRRNFALKTGQLIDWTAENVAKLKNMWLGLNGYSAVNHPTPKGGGF